MAIWVKMQSPRKEIRMLSNPWQGDVVFSNHRFPPNECVKSVFPLLFNHRFSQIFLPMNAGICRVIVPVS